MKGFLSDAGAEALKKVLQDHGQSPEGGIEMVLALVISVRAGWNYHRPGQVWRLHEPVRLMREVAYETLTGRNYWRPDKSQAVESLFDCKSQSEIWEVAAVITNGYIQRRQNS